ncbi:hypothetical protein QTP70_027013, partial [Hemibagrus guttatus]
LFYFAVHGREVCSENNIATTKYPCVKSTGEVTTCYSCLSHNCDDARSVGSGVNAADDMVKEL